MEDGLMLKIMGFVVELDGKIGRTTNHLDCGTAVVEQSSCFRKVALSSKRIFLAQISILMGF